MGAEFHIVTIANDLAAHQTMRKTMAEVGFVEGPCRFTLLDNTAGNRFDPYQVLRDLPGDGDEPYVVLCHQDLLFSDQCSMEILRSVIRQLNAIDPDWAVAGNAGDDKYGHMIKHMDDPCGMSRGAATPRRVISLDENFLLLRRDRPCYPSKAGRGFHFYATDLCLNAWMRGRGSYVVGFPVKHLSTGALRSEAFLEGRREIMNIWRPRLLVGIVHTPCACFRVSALAPLEWALQFRFLAGILRQMGFAVIRVPGTGAEQAPTSVKHIGTSGKDGAAGVKQVAKSGEHIGS